VYNLHRELNVFHDNDVRLSYDDKRKLAGYRDTNLDRLKSGLDKLGEEDGNDYAHPLRTCNQGSYATYTIIQHPDNDYDIDVALIFAKEGLPSTALDARKRIAAALQQGGGNFARPPEWRTNCATVWYAEGYHIDLAIYREFEDEFGATIIEHAGPDWTPRDPMEITNWFNKEVRERSPSGEMGADVEAGQMRRVVRLLKAFAKSREPVKLPGGLIISVLVSKCYHPDSSRDDVSLYETMVAIHNRLIGCVSVMNPVGGSEELTYKPEYTRQVERLRDELGEAIEELQVLFKSDCTEADAMQAWDQVFRHPFWSDAEKLDRGLAYKYSAAAQELADVEIEVGVAAQKGGRIVRPHYSGGTIKKDWWLRFTLISTSVTRPYSIRWTVKNYGPEAEAADDLGPRVDSDGAAKVQWESIGYTGCHTMTCELHRDGVVLGRTRHVVSVP
jgi:hypothetical protein